MKIATGLMGLVLSVSLFSFVLHDDKFPEKGSDKHITKPVLRFVIKNTTKKDVYLAVDFKPYDRSSETGSDWVTWGWYTLSPGKSYYFESTNWIFYYYAESTATNLLGQKLVWGGDHGFYVRGELHYFKEQTVYQTDATYQSEGDKEWYEYRIDLKK